jgi:probable rRNA maturation factor
MSHAAARAVSVQLDGTRSPVSAARLAELSKRVLAAQRVPRALVSVTMVTPRAIARLNREHLGHRGPTDVITFTLTAHAAADGVVVADIYICPDVARAQALAHRVGIREEMARLVIHGTLHACGWEHPDDAGRMTSPMWRRQEQLLKRFWTASAPRA